MSATGRVPRRAAPPAAVPSVGKRRPMKLATVAERVLANGLRMIVARRPGIPRFEARLRIPTVRHGDAGDGARHLLLAETLLSGTSRRTSVDIAESFQRLGGSLHASSDAEWVVVGGSALSVSLGAFLDLLSEVVTEACFPSDEVALERERLVQEITLAGSQPENIARDALVRRLFGAHPYGRGMAEAAAVARVRPAVLRKEHAARLLPAGAILVIVGDLAPARVLDRAELALAGWGPTGPPTADRLTPPTPPAPGPIQVIDRPGAVQTNIRMAGPAVPRGHPDLTALVLANAVFGGYFTSRLVDNIRERRGYTYSPGSGLEHRQVASSFLVSADVGTDVTAAALVEIRYELGRMVATLVEQAELDAARRYLQGTLAMSVQTQAGLTSYLATLAAFGLGVEYLRQYPAALEVVTVDAVRDAASRYLALPGLVTVLVGDAATVGPALEALDVVEVRQTR
jgi:predicted Zn-dependent peptidase